MRWLTELEAREKRPDRTALLRLLCAWDPGWLGSAGPLTTVWLKQGKLAHGEGRGQRKIARVSPGTLDTTRIGFLYQPSRFFAPGSGRTFIWKNGHALMYLRPGFGFMVSTAAGVSKTSSNK